jgi:adenylyltransferase/sulfurtransferase
MSERPKRVLIVGLGGLGCPVAAILARASTAELWLCDDDEVDLTNLHRQILYRDADVGAHKLDAAKKTLILGGVDPSRLVSHRARLLPKNARQLVSEVDLVVEGADNFATKFLVADACHLERRPAVHGAGIRWVGTAWAVAPEGKPCYRCLFEDLPKGPQASCDSAGVMGPVVGIVGALMAELALRVATGRPTYAELWSLDGKSDSLRKVPVSARAACPLCGEDASIRDTDETRYLAGTRAA